MKTPLSFSLLAAIAVTLTTSGCAGMASTARRAGAVSAGALAGGALGYALGDKSPTATGAGAVAGAGLAHLALGTDPEVRQAGFDTGYVQGQSDAIKRQYFLRQGLEAQPLARPANQGAPVYYVAPGPAVTVDGRKLAPHEVSVRVVE